MFTLRSVYVELKSESTTKKEVLDPLPSALRLPQSTTLIHQLKDNFDFS